MTNEEAKDYLALNSCKCCKDFHRGECHGLADCFESKRLAVLALYQQIPKKPIQKLDGIKCPNCETEIYSNMNYCSNCGQRIGGV